MTTLDTKGRHLLVECYEADFDALNDLDRIRTAFLEAAAEMDVTIVSDHFHKFAPQGVSGAVVIAESHLTIHTWPEDGYAAVDFYTCGDADPHRGFLTLARSLGSVTLRIAEFERGFVENNGAPRQVAAWSYSFGPSGVTHSEQQAVTMAG